MVFARVCWTKYNAKFLRYCSLNFDTFFFYPPEILWQQQDSDLPVRTQQKGRKHGF
jgi:hypothetical protein